MNNDLDIILGGAEYERGPYMKQYEDRADQKTRRRRSKHGSEPSPPQEGHRCREHGPDESVCSVCGKARPWGVPKMEDRMHPDCWGFVPLPREGKFSFQYPICPDCRQARKGPFCYI